MVPLPARQEQSTPLQPIGTQATMLAVRRSRLRARTPDDEPYTATPTIEELRAICCGMLEAIAEECREASAVTLALDAGRRLDFVGAGSRYEFEHSPGPIDASTGDPVLLRLGSRETEGTVAAIDAGAIEVTIVDDLGLKVSAGAEQLLDAPWLIERPGYHGRGDQAWRSTAPAARAPVSPVRRRPLSAVRCPSSGQAAVRRADKPRATACCGMSAGRTRATPSGPKRCPSSGQGATGQPCISVHDVDERNPGHHGRHRDSL